MPGRIHWTGRAPFLAFVCAFCLTGCDPFGSSTFTLTLTASPDGAGTVSADPSQAQYEKSAVVRLTASAANGWVFARWEGDCSGASSPADLTMNADKSVTAVFVAAPASSKTLHDFRFVSPAVAVAIDETAHTGTATLPYGTAVTGLVAVFSTTGARVLVGGTEQVSGTTANDFTNPVTYTVVAADGSTQDYVVTVAVAPRLFTGIVSHFCGTVGGIGAADGTGSDARFYDPDSIAYDGSYLYVTDAGNHTVRKIDPGTGAVTTLAGSAGTPGTADGTGSGARFNKPNGIVFAGGGLYVCDNGNHAIRKIDPGTGAVTTLAGSAGTSGTADGTGTDAGFCNPAGIAYDGSAYLDVADEGNDTIRQVVPGTGAVTTVAGTAKSSGSADGDRATARFTGPCGLVYVGGFLYVTDIPSQTVRKVDPGTGEVTTLAGTAESTGHTDDTGAAARFNNPYGIACDGTDLYVNDRGNSTIRRITLAGAVTTLVGSPGQIGIDDGTGAAARFQKPQGLLYAGGDFYVADTCNNTIRKVTSSWAVTTLAGCAAAWGTADGTGSSSRFYVPMGIAAAGDSLYVADTGNHTIRRIDLSTATSSTLAGSPGTSGTASGTGLSAGFNTPYGLASDGACLYVADTLNHAIRRIDPSTAEVTTLAGTVGTSGIANGNGTAASFKNPTYVAFSGGYLYVSDAGNHVIRRIDPTTAEVTTWAGTSGTSGSANGIGTAASFNSPMGIACTADAVYVADSGNTIRKIAKGTVEVTTLAGTAGSAGSTDGTGSSARFNMPYGLAAVGSNLYVADLWNDTIRKIVMATGEVTTLAGGAGKYGSADGTGTDARFIQPAGIVFDGMDLYVADRGNYAIRRIQ